MLYDNSQPFYSFGLRPNLWGKVFRRNILYNNQLEVDDRITLGEDAACTYPTMLQAKSLFVLNKPLYHYRFNEKSITNSSKKNMFKNNELLIDYLFKALGNKHIFIEQIYHYIAFLIYLSFFNELMSQKSTILKIRDLKKELSKDYYVKALENIKYNNINFRKKFIFKLIKRKRFFILILFTKFWLFTKRFGENYGNKRQTRKD